MLKYLLILFVLAMAVAPLTHFLPSKRQRQLARMREYAAVHGLFVEFRDLPAVDGLSPAGERAQQVIYYGKRLPPSRGEPRPRRAWVRDTEGWRGQQRRWEAPGAADAMPGSVRALGVDDGSCGAYWLVDGVVEVVEEIVRAVEDWEAALGGRKTARIP